MACDTVAGFLLQFIRWQIPFAGSESQQVVEYCLISYGCKVYKRAAVHPPRSNKMPTDQDLPLVWPVARSFHPGSVPLPLHQEWLVLVATPPSKFANAELMKIPNFLHLTPPASQASKSENPFSIIDIFITLYTLFVYRDLHRVAERVGYQRKDWKSFTYHNQN